MKKKLLGKRDADAKEDAVEAKVEDKSGKKREQKVERKIKEGEQKLKNKVAYATKQITQKEDAVAKGTKNNDLSNSI